MDLEQRVKDLEIFREQFFQTIICKEHFQSELDKIERGKLLAISHPHIFSVDMHKYSQILTGYIHK